VYNIEQLNDQILIVNDWPLFCGTKRIEIDGQFSLKYIKAMIAQK